MTSSRQYPPRTAHEIIDEILRREGSTYTNRPADRGGPTKFGITLQTYRRHHPNATAADVAALTEGEARSIYEHDYISEPGFGGITDPWLKSLLIDFGVTSGPETAIKALQVALGVKADGVLGPVTRAALDAASAYAVYASVARQYLGHFVSIPFREAAVINFLRTHPTSQLHNLRGWCNRFMDFIR